MTTRHGRIGWPLPDQLNAEQRLVYEAITTGRRSKGSQAFDLTDDLGRLHGPFNAMVMAPGVGLALQELGTAIRFGSHLTARAREACILLVSVAERCDFERFAHAAAGQTVGLTADELAALDEGRCPPTFDRAERASVQTVVSLLEAGDLSDEQFQGALGDIGVERLLEIVVLVGYYRLLALAMRTCRTPLPPGVESEFHPSAE